MKKYSDLEYLRLSKWERIKYTILCFFFPIPTDLWNALKKLGNGCVTLF